MQFDGFGKIGKRYEKRYKKYFHRLDIRRFDMQHEAWLFCENNM